MADAKGRFAVPRFEYRDVVKVVAERDPANCSDNGLASNEAMQEFIANSKEVLKVSREVSASEVADFSFARRAVNEIREGK